MSLMPRFWNVNTGIFLRRYCYERMGAGFVSMAATQIVSSLWHGLREGFLAFFSGTILMFQSSKGASLPSHWPPPKACPCVCALRFAAGALSAWCAPWRLAQGAVRWGGP